MRFWRRLMPTSTIAAHQRNVPSHVKFCMTSTARSWASLVLSCVVFGCDTSGQNRAIDDDAADALYADNGDAPCTSEASPAAQDGEIELRYDRSPPCRLVFRETGIVLRGDSAGRWPYPGTQVARDSRGRFFTSVAGNTTQIAVWNPDGTFFDTLGRKGDGPGEFGQGGTEPQLMVDPRDRLHVRATGGRTIVYDTSLGVAYQSFFRNPWSPRTLAFIDDSTFLSSSPPGQPTHYFAILDRTGAVVRRFGEIDWQGTPPERREPPHRGIAYQGGSRFVAGPAYPSTDGYVLEEWSLDDTLVRRFHRSPPWFAAAHSNAGRPGAGDGSAPPGPSIQFNNLGPDGLVLMTVIVANDRWRPLMESERGRGMANRFYNAHLEVIDPTKGAVVASEAVNNSAQRTGILPRGYFPGTNLGYRVGESPDGLPVVSIVEYTLKRRR